MIKSPSSQADNAPTQSAPETVSKARGTRVAGAKWRKIEETLLHEIEGGVIVVGDRIPPEPELAERFGVNRLTVRQALSSLKDRGLISIEPGRGTFVRRRLVTFDANRMHVSQGLGATSSPYQQRILSLETTPCNKEVASFLALKAKSSVLTVTFIGESEGVPVVYGVKYLPAARFAGFPAMVALDGPASGELYPIKAATEACGVKGFAREFTDLIVRFPTPREAKALNLTLEDPIAETVTLDVDEAGKPITYGVTCFAATRMRFRLGPE